MSILLVILNSLVPIAFVISLGVLAGRTGVVKARAQRSAGQPCVGLLPAGSSVQSDRDDADRGVRTMAVLSWYRAWTIGRVCRRIHRCITVFRKPIASDSLQALNSSFPNMAFMGVPVLTSIIGTSAALSVVVGNLISSFVLIPLTLTLLEAGASGQKGKKTSAVVGGAIYSALKQPLVWGPLIGVLMAVFRVPLAEVGQKSFALIGDATSGVALFAMGLLLSGQKLRIGLPSLSNTTFKNLLQPAVMWGLALVLGVTGLYRREMILLGALPTASMTAMFAVQYKVYTQESDATIVISTIFSIASLGVLIALTA